MKKRNQIAITVVIAIIMLACNALTQPSGGNEQPPTLPPAATIPPAIPTVEVPPPQANTIFTDDFSVTSAEMETYDGTDGSSGTANGIYFVRSIGDLWQWGRSASEFADTVIEVDVTMFEGPANNNVGFGVICRLQEREDTSVDGYMLAISADGYYTIRSIVSSNMSPIVDWSYSDAINQGFQSNTLRATCNGSELSLEVNDQLVASGSAPADGSTSGAIAFSAISFETDNPVAEVHFDNLIVSQP